MIIIRAAELDGLRLLFLLPLLDGETMSSLIRQIKRCVHGAIFPDFSCCSSPSSPMSSSVFLPVSQVNTHNYSTLNQGRGGGVGSKVAAAREPPVFFSSGANFSRMFSFLREIIITDIDFASALETAGAAAAATRGTTRKKTTRNIFFFLLAIPQVVYFRLLPVFQNTALCLLPKDETERDTDSITERSKTQKFCYRRNETKNTP